ncbi:MAG TPA: DUF362 domain-containing protein [Syntrophorhabdales bacterium]|nr:DUF362 domain-containing protein [Syntrophorhabdales bacterium]
MPHITIEKGRLSPGLLKRLREYYGAIVNPGYVDEKWMKWRNDPHITRYVAKNEGETAAWVIYDPRTSMIEEMLALAKGESEDLLSHVMDALIARESLVATEILERDHERYRWMVEYGFRPTRMFAAHGLSFVRMELSTAVYLERFRGERPVRAYDEELVAIERVPPAQTPEDIGEALGSLIRRLGGLAHFVKPGGTIVIKPNIVSDHGMKDGAYTGGIVTDIRLVEALVRLLLPVAGRIIVAEGSSINRSETGRMFALYGYDRLPDMDRRKVRLVDLNADALVEKRVPGGKRMTSRKVPLTIETADTIISLPVLKIHFAAIASLAMKNLQGAMPPLEKYMTHFFGLWQSLVNIHLLIKPGLTIVDGLTGLEDFGPVSGRPKPMNLLIGGTNPVAVDSVAMRVMGLDPASSPPVLLAYLQGLGPIEPEKIRVAGASIEEVASPFVRPEIILKGGRDLSIHNGGACPGCSGYLHFVLSKLRKPDPRDRTRLLIDRPFEPKKHIFLGPSTDTPVDPGTTNLFMGICQQHHAALGTHMPGCPPHAEVIMNAVFNLFPDVEMPKYADETEEAKLGRMLEEVLAHN